MCAMVLAALSAVRLVMLCCQRCQLFCPNTALSLVHKAVNACLRELKGKKNTHTQKGWGEREKGGRTMTISISSARKHFHVSDEKIVRDFFSSFQMSIRKGVLQSLRSSQQFVVHTWNQSDLEPTASQSSKQAACMGEGRVSISPMPHNSYRRIHDVASTELRKQATLRQTPSHI